MSTEEMNKTEIATKIQQAGGRLYLVGGALRDTMLGKESHDEDYCVTGLTPEEFQGLFPEARVQGKSFAVFVLKNVEFAMARTETKVGKGHKEFVIQTNQGITIEQDLARRDITINSMAKDVLTGEIIDPFGGQKDLQNHIIRATTEHFNEDPLRVYRVARLAAKLRFAVEDKTIQRMKDLKEELETLPKERVLVELEKAFLTEKPSIFFEVLKKAEVLEVHFPEIQQLIGVEQPAVYHPEGDAFQHTMLVLTKATELTKGWKEKHKVQIRFAALVHDLGKGLTPKEEYPHHYGHEERGVALVEQLGHRLGIPNHWMKCGKIAAKEHMVAGKFAEMKANTKVSFIERIAKTTLGLDGLEIIAVCDRMGSSQKGVENIAFAEIGKKCLQEINGEWVKEKYGITDGIALKSRLHEERVKWMKQQ